jgi:TonB family protein
MRRRRAAGRPRLGVERDDASPPRFESLIFTPGRSGEPRRSSRSFALGIGLLLAVLIHVGVIGAVLWRAELAPVRERLIRVVLFARQAIAVPEEQPPAPLPARPEPAPTAAVARPPKRPASARASEQAPALPPSAPAAPSEQPVASAPIPVGREATSAKPRYKRNPEPPYPALARRRRQEGVVLLAVQVDAEGRPETVAVQVSSGFAVLDEAAIAAVEDWEFEPGRLDGTPVRSRVEVPIHFRLGRGAAP